jgi:hypothetical protein
VQKYSRSSYDENRTILKHEKGMENSGTSRGQQLETLLYLWRKSETAGQEPVSRKCCRRLVEVCIETLSDALVTSKWNQIFKNQSIYIPSSFIEQVFESENGLLTSISDFVCR